MDTEELIDNIKIKVEEEYYEESEFFSRTYAFDIKQITAGESIDHNNINNNNYIKTEQKSQKLLMKQCFVVIEKCHLLDSIRSKRSKLKTPPKATSNRNLRVSCDQCDKSFSRKQSLKRHMLIHQGIKPFKCNICGKRFHWKNVLKTHQATHSNAKPFKCNY